MFPVIPRFHLSSVPEFALDVLTACQLPAFMTDGDR